MINIQSFGDRHRGRRRKNNEDFITWFEPIEPVEIESSGCLYILADGVGGAARGERASQYAAQKVLHEYYQNPNVEPGERLRQLISQASEEIFTHADQSARITRMATTMVAAIVRAGKLIVAHVGDSRAYLIRDGVATQLTRDHSIVGEMIANGDMTEAEAQASKIKNKLTRSIGGEAEVHVDIHAPISLQAGDKILLCSDGLTRYALQDDIAKLTAEGSPREIVERLIRFANKRGGADNVSAILISYGATEFLEPTIRIDRPLRPPDFEDTLDTIPDVRPRRRQAATPMIWATIFLGIFGVLIVGAANGLFQMQQPPQQPVATKFPIESLTLMPTSTFTQSNFLISSPPPTLTLPATPTHTQTETPTYTQTATQTPTATSTPLSTQPTGVECFYIVKNGDTYNGLVQRFRPNGAEPIRCERIGYKGCNLEDRAYIQAGWEVIISGVQPNSCTIYGGTIR